MSTALIRVGTIYIPVKDVDISAEWYESKLGAELSYKDQNKAIINFAFQSFFLVKSDPTESANFTDLNGKEQFSITFEVDGLEVLEALHKEFIQKGITVGNIEDRGHSGRNFVFYDVDGNMFDVWSELSPAFKKML